MTSNPSFLIPGLCNWGYKLWFISVQFSSKAGVKEPTRWKNVVRIMGENGHNSAQRLTERVLDDRDACHSSVSLNLFIIPAS